MSVSMYAPRLVVEALGLPLKASSPAKQDENCLLCGHPVQKGEPAGQLSLGSSWLDWPFVADRSSTTICQWCPSISKRIFMQKRSKMVVASDGSAYSIAALADRVAMLLNPPKVPSVWVYGTAQMQHLIWKAPVTIDPDLIHLQLGDASGLIRRQFVIDVARETIEVRTKTEKMPLVLALDAMSDTHGLPTKHATPKLAAMYARCTAAELWAITALVYKPDWTQAGERPTPIDRKEFDQ